MTALAVLIVAPAFAAGKVDANPSGIQPGIQDVIKRLYQCHNLTSSPDLDATQRQQIDARIEKYRCATLSCDISKLAGGFTSSSKVEAELTAQFKALGGNSCP